MEGRGDNSPQKSAKNTEKEKGFEQKIAKVTKEREMADGWRGGG